MNAIRLGFTLALVFILAAPAQAGDYKRPSWSDTDRDCLNTREELMAAQCRPILLSTDGCKIVRAACLDLYSGATVASDSPAQAFQVDHLYPASEAWKRRAWTREEFGRFFNDARNLVITRARTNLRKSDKMPQEWCPVRRGARLWAAKRFRATAATWRLAILPAEEVGLKAWERGECAPGAKIL